MSGGGGDPPLRSVDSEGAGRGIEPRKVFVMRADAVRSVEGNTGVRQWPNTAVELRISPPGLVVYDVVKDLVGRATKRAYSSHAMPEAPRPSTGSPFPTARSSAWWLQQIDRAVRRDQEGVGA